MNQKSAPFLTVACAALITALLGGWMTLLAMHQPWLGIEFDRQGPKNGLRIEKIAPDGPSVGFQPGDVLISIDGGDGRIIDLESFDVIEEPDGVANYTVLDSFFARQNAIFEILSGERVYFNTSDGARKAVDVAPSRPLADLPIGFWIQICVGLIGIIIGACVWALRPDMPGARTLGVGSVALVASTYPSAIYLNRELALADPLFFILNTINPLGSLAFAGSLLVLFLVYPKRLLPPVVLALIIAGFGIWWLLDVLRIGFAGPDIGRYLPIGLAALSAPVMAGIQYRAARGKPHLRAALVWFALSLVLATVIFILLFVTPSLIGEPPVAPQALSYALAILVYAGIALGIVRYQLFDLDRWAFRILFYVGAALVFAALDVFLVSAFALDLLPAFSLALLIVAMVYLPMRDILARRLMPVPDGRHVMFQKVVGIALTPDETERDAGWVQLLRTIFDPLSIEHSIEHPQPEISEDGQILLLPGNGYVSPQKLRLAHGGRKLFSRSDLDLAKELCEMLVHTSKATNAFERGTEQERSRIARDAHDNIGAKLLSALHGTRPEQKDVMIREALQELRDIINHRSATEQTLEESLAELRLETVERLSIAGLSVDWQVEGAQTKGISHDIIHALKSIIRESVSNTLRHANASGMTVSVLLDEGNLRLSISDDGSGMPATGPKSGGLGLDSMHARVNALSGTLQADNLEPGFQLSADIPITIGNSS